MQDWLKTQLANNFAAFAGARLSGSVPLTESVLNRWLQAALAKDGAVPSVMDGQIPMDALKHFVTSARVEIADGVLTLHFELEV